MDGNHSAAVQRLVEADPIFAGPLILQLNKLLGFAWQMDGVNLCGIQKHFSQALKTDMCIL